jgi:hypothetical protein
MSNAPLRPVPVPVPVPVVVLEIGVERSVTS